MWMPLSVADIYSFEIAFCTKIYICQGTIYEESVLYIAGYITGGLVTTFFGGSSFGAREMLLVGLTGKLSR